MNINQIKYFLAIVNTESFSNAAYDLFISQSSISKQIKALEDELGVILFKREHSKVCLTEAGEEFFKYAKDAYEYHQNMLLSIEQFQIMKQSTIRMGSIPIVSSYGVANRIAAFTSNHNDYKICFDMHENNQAYVVKELLEGVIDFALVRLENITNQEDYDIIPYVVDEFVLVCHKNNKLASKNVVSPKEICGSPMLLLDTHSVLHKIVIDEFAKQKLPIEIQCVASRHKILMEILSTSSAVSLLPSRLVDLKTFPNLVTIPITDSIKSCVALVKLKGNKMNKISKTFC